MHDNTDVLPFEADVLSPEDVDSRHRRLRRKLLLWRAAGTALAGVSGASLLVALVSLPDVGTSLLVAWIAVGLTLAMGWLSLGSLKALRAFEADMDHLTADQVIVLADLVETCPSIREWMLRHQLSPEDVRTYQLEDAIDYAEELEDDERRLEAAGRVHTALAQEAAAK